MPVRRGADAAQPHHQGQIRVEPDARRRAPALGLLNTPDAVRYLQEAAGNRAVQSVIEGRLQRDVTLEDLDELNDLWYPRVMDEELRAYQGYMKKGWDGTDFKDGTIYYTEVGKSELIELKLSVVNQYWDKKYEGFKRVSGPDVMKNCADHAIRQTFNEPKDGAAYLSKQATSKGEYDGSEHLEGILDALEAGTYVVVLSPQNPHFIRLIVTEKGGNLKMSQKDGDSGVYEKTDSVSAAAAYMATVAGKGLVYEI